MAAAYNSQERFPPPKCYPETRNVILAQIIRWVEEQVNGIHRKRILWIYGPAGAGKSAIAQTISEIFSQQQALAASFFFSRANDRRGTENYIIGTIAYQLTNSIPEIRDDIGKAVARDPSVLRLSLDIQIQRLIVAPFLSFLSRPNAYHGRRYLIIIDGLDECDGDDNQSRLIALIAELFGTHKLPFTFIFTSRPEPQIRNAFRRNSRISTLTQEFELNPSPEDIRTFLTSCFHEMRNEHPCLVSLNEHWPSQADIDMLVYQSSGYFIYASTIIKFIGDKDTRPTDNLKLVLSWKSIPLLALDNIYHHILLTVPPTRQPILISILEVLIAVRLVGKYLRSVDLEALLGLPDGDVQVVLRRMHSLLKNIDSENSCIDFFHASFKEFLEDKERSGIFHVDQDLAHAKIAEAFVKQARIGLLPVGYHAFWTTHAELGQNKINLAQFMEDIQAVKTTTWKQWIYIDSGYSGEIGSSLVEGWIYELKVNARGYLSVLS